jgi:hypothetical protein
MTIAMKKSLRKTQENIRKRAPLIEKKFAAAGLRSDAAVVFSTAQYFETLKKLAKE